MSKGLLGKLERFAIASPFLQRSYQGWYIHRIASFKFPSDILWLYFPPRLTTSSKAMVEFSIHVRVAKEFGTKPVLKYLKEKLLAMLSGEVTHKDNGANSSFLIWTMRKKSSIPDPIGKSIQKHRGKIGDGTNWIPYSTNERCFYCKPKSRPLQIWLLQFK